MTLAPNSTAALNSRSVSQNNYFSSKSHVGSVLLLLFWLVLGRSDLLGESRGKSLEHGINVGTIGMHMSPECCDSAKADSEIDQLKKMGFDHVRLGVQLGYVFNPNRPKEIRNDESQLQHVRDAIRIFTDRRLPIILSIRIDKPDDAKRFSLNDPRFVSDFSLFWRSFSHSLNHFSKDLLLFEVLNEPYVDAPLDHRAELNDINEWVNHQQPLLIAAIRKGAPKHTIVATGPRGSNIYGLLWLDLAPLIHDKNVIYSFHYYNPRHFAQDGDGDYPSSGPPPTVNATCNPPRIKPTDSNDVGKMSCQNDASNATYWDERVIDSEIDLARNWRDRNKAILICDEFGVKEGAHGQIQWLKDVRSRLDKDGIGWTYWDYKNCPTECGHTGFGLFDQNSSGWSDFQRMLVALDRNVPH